MISSIVRGGRLARSDHGRALDANRPILDILDPREHRRLIAITGGVALCGMLTTRMALGWELWKAVALVLVVMAVPFALKWRADARRFGVTATVAGIMVTVQGLHSIEHLAQWAQRHILHLPLRASNGLLSPANSEWVHFVWNWSVTILVVMLMFRGMRGFWGWALLVWALAHTLEHTYMFVRYLQVSAELRALGVGSVTAQGLPGIFGEGGWLDLNAGPQVQVFCRLPGVTTADRVDTHFVWNTGEILLLLPAVHVFLRSKAAAAARVADPAYTRAL